MDTSQEFIKMCARAKEIQEYGRDNFKKLRPLFTFDLMLERVALVLWIPKKMRERLKIRGDEYIISIESNNEKNVLIEEGTKGGMYWLPRQDQLQDMVKDEPRNLVIDIYDWTEESLLNGIEAEKFTSMEQLWLAFVMSEKYNKKWIKENWVRIKKDNKNG